jgi:AcrR family transcriptional regulator
MLKRTDTKRRLIEKAARLFLEKGYQETTLTEVAKGIGVTGPALYRYVKSKEELLFLIFDQGIQLFTDRVVNPAKKVSDPEDKVRAMIRTGALLWIERPEMVLLLFQPTKSLPKKRRKYYSASAKDNAKFVENALRELKISKNVQDSIDVTVATFILIGTGIWLHKWYKRTGRIGVEQLIEDMTKFFLQGFYGRKVDSNTTAQGL